MKNALAILLFAVAAILLLPKLMKGQTVTLPKIAEPPTPTQTPDSSRKDVLGQIIGGVTTILPIIRDWNSHPSSANVEVSL